MQFDRNDNGNTGLPDDRAIYEIRNMSGAVDLSRPGTIADQSNDFDRRRAVLSPELQRESEKHLHLKRYLASLPMDEIGVPDYRPSLTVQDRSLNYRNLIYPVDKEVMVHIYPGIGGDRDCYVPVEPDCSPEITSLLEQVDAELAMNIDRLEELAASQNKEQGLLDCLDRICMSVGGRLEPDPMTLDTAGWEGLKYLMIREKIGLGKIQPFIDDPYIEDVSCSGVGSVFLEHRIFGGLKSSITFESGSELDRFVIKLSERIGRPATTRDPLIDSVLPDGSRINIVYGDDVSRKGSNFTIRKFSETPFSILDLVESGTLSYEMASYIWLMVSSGMNTFVSGETASGKTTLLNAISTFINPDGKIVSIEDTPELQVPHENWTREVVRGSAVGGSAVSMFDLLRSALRQRPDEIIIGEIRGEEGSVVFQAMQTGHPCMATFHASTVEKLIQRLTGQPINIPKPYIDNLNLVILMSAVKLPDGRTARRVTSINEIIGYDPTSESFGFIEVFRWDPATDTFEFPGYLNTNLLEHVVAVRNGLAPGNDQAIYEKLYQRAQVLKRLYQKEVNDFYELHDVLSQAGREGHLR
jgi:flagellar protein FlaI